MEGLLSWSLEMMMTLEGIAVAMSVTISLLLSVFSFFIFYLMSFYLASLMLYIPLERLNEERTITLGVCNYAVAYRGS